MTEPVLGKGRWLNVLPVSVLALFVLSVPFKLATVHVAAGFLVLTAFGLRYRDFKTGPVRAFTEISLAWLMPVLLAGIVHAFANTPSAASFAETLKVLARLFGAGLGVLFLLQYERVLPKHVIFLASLAILLVAMSGYHEWFTLWGHGNWPSWTGARVMGAIFNPNPFGFFMALGVVIAVALLRSNLAGAWPIFMVLGCSPLLWVSGSRGSILSALAGLLCLFALKRRSVLGVLVVSGAILAMLYGAGWLYPQRVLSDDTRIAILRFAVMKWVEAPWFGWGVGSLTVLEGNVSGQAAHNVLLDLAVSCGTIAVVGWLFAAARILHMLSRSDHPAACGVLSVFVVLLVSGSVDYSLLTATIYQGVWMLTAVLACWVGARRAGAPEGAK